MGLFEIRKFSYYPKLIHINGHQEVTCEHTKGNNEADNLANYRNHSSYELDLPISDLNEIEKLDYFEKDGKMYLKLDIYQERNKKKPLKLIPEDKFPKYNVVFIDEVQDFSIKMVNYITNT